MGQAASARLSSFTHRLQPVGPVWPGPADPSLTSGLSLSLPYCPASQVCSRVDGTPFCPMALLHPFLLATPPPSGCNSNLTSEKRSCQITLPKVVPFIIIMSIILHLSPQILLQQCFSQFQVFYLLVYLSSAYPNPRVC